MIVFLDGQNIDWLPEEKYYKCPSCLGWKPHFNQGHRYYCDSNHIKVYNEELDQYQYITREQVNQLLMKEDQRK